MTNLKSVLPRWFLLLTLGNIISYSAVHIDYLFEHDAFMYANICVTTAWDFIFPVICAALMLFLYVKWNTKSALLGGMLLCSTKFFYSLFFYYLDYVINESYITRDAILMSLMISALVIVVSYAHSVIFFLVMLAITRFCKHSGNKPTKERLNCELGKGDFFDLDNSTVRGLISLSAIQLILYTVLEIIDTREFLSKYGNTADTEELIFIIFKYVFLLGLFILSHYSNVKLLQKLNNKYTNGDN